MAAAENCFATYPSLSDKTAIVTGGATGIGAEITLELSRHGAHVTVVDFNEQAGKNLERKCPHGIAFHKVDVTDTDQLRRSIDCCAARKGDIDIVVANAANDARHSVEELTDKLWDDAMAINLKHQFFLAKAAYPHMKKHGGSIICLGSISWLNGTTGMPAYTTAKAGVQGLVRTLARLWGGDRIRVNAVLPGWTMTSKQRELWVDEAAEREIAQNQCLPGHVMPEDISRLVAFLASDDAAMITQQSIVVDGGWV